MSDSNRPGSDRVRAEAKRAGERFVQLVRTRIPAPPRAEARRRIRSKPGFFASLGVEARSAIRNHAGPEIMGPSRNE